MPGENRSGSAAGGRHEPLRLLRYAGGKHKHMTALRHHLPAASAITGRYIEPFVGGAAVFFALRPHESVLADVDEQLIEFYRTVRQAPEEVWCRFSAYPAGREAYYQIRSWNPQELDSVDCAARLLYLNRTCFKGMWRHNAQGQFNVGYGGEERRLVVTREHVRKAAEFLRKAQLLVSDFEAVVDKSVAGDFLFVDPPYEPGARELRLVHYIGGKFTYDDHARLAAALHRASARGVRWAVTTSAHPDILELFDGYRIMDFRRETERAGRVQHKRTLEVMICSD